MAVDRCVCHEVSFAKLKAIAQRKGLDFDGLQRATACGSSCGLCEQYIRRMLETGRTVFEPFPPEQAEEQDWSQDSPSGR